MVGATLVALGLSNGTCVLIINIIKFFKNSGACKTKFFRGVVFLHCMAVKYKNNNKARMLVIMVDTFIHSILVVGAWLIGVVQGSFVEHF